MLVDRPRLFLKRWIVLDKRLHILNRVNFLINLFLSGKVFDHLLYVLPDLAKVQIQIIRVKVVAVRGDHYFLQFFWNPTDSSQINAIICQGQNFVQHRLIRPLHKQGLNKYFQSRNYERMKVSTVAASSRRSRMTKVTSFFPAC